MEQLQIFFIYEGVTIQILGSEKETMKEIIQKFCDKAEVDKKTIYCLYSGNLLDEKQTLENLIKRNKNQKIQLLVYKTDDKKKETIDYLVKPTQIVCPGCKDIALIKFHDYKISINCKNNHNIKKIFLKDFVKSQRIDESKIICNICEKNNKGDSFEKNFFICVNCKKNLCPLCKSSHDKSHNIFNYEQKNYICFEHSDNFSSYCKTCKINLCNACENEHSQHDVISLGKLFPKKNELKDKMDELDNKINKLKDEIKYIINILNNFIENLEILYHLGNYIDNSFNIKSKNYEILNNIQEINNNYVLEDITKILDIKDIDEKFKNIFEIYLKMNYKEEIIPAESKKNPDIESDNKLLINNTLSNLINNIQSQINPNEINSNLMNINNNLNIANNNN